MPLGGNGDICVTSSAKVHVIVDLQGWHTATSGFHGLVAQRAFDSRSSGGKIPAGHESEIPLAGLFDIPSAPGAVAVNVTVTQPDNAGWLVAYPCGSARPLASTINFNAGDTVANLSISGLGTNGKLCLWSTAAVQVVIDTQGWYNP